jgi:putative PIN family toxin of toxin-antitoxin system
VSPSRFRVVIYTNTLLRGVLSEASAAAKVRRAAESRTVVPLLSKPVLDEYRAVFGSAALLQRFPQLSARQIDFLIERLVYLGDYVRSPKARFNYARDPLDEKFIELASELKATHIITSDDDLLALPNNRRDAGKRFRQRLPQRGCDGGRHLCSSARRRTGVTQPRARLGPINQSRR